jgi:toxin YoeB
MRIVFSESAWGEFELLLQDRRLLKRVNQLSADILRNGNTGIGKPERLSGDLSRLWSRRIDERHRLVYRLTGEDMLEIVRCYGHYGEE